jgi:hypothetical protein
MVECKKLPPVGALIVARPRNRKTGMLARVVDILKLKPRMEIQVVLSKVPAMYERRGWVVGKLVAFTWGGEWGWSLRWLRPDPDEPGAIRDSRRRRAR